MNYETLNFSYRNHSNILLKAFDPVHLVTSQFLAKYDNRVDQQISQTHRTVTHDAPWSFLLKILQTLVFSHEMLLKVPDSFDLVIKTIWFGSTKLIDRK